MHDVVCKSFLLSSNLAGYVGMCFRQVKKSLNNMVQCVAIVYVMGISLLEWVD